MAPLHLKVGASKGCTNAGLRGAVRGHQPHILPSVHTCTDHLGVRLACPSCAKTFLNLGVTGKSIVYSKISLFYIYCCQICCFLSVLKITSCVFFIFSFVSPVEAPGRPFFVFSVLKVTSCIFVFLFVRSVEVPGRPFLCSLFS